MTTFTPKQLRNWREYERIRLSGAYNMFDPRARAMTTQSVDEWCLNMKHYSELKEAATKEEVK